jgi:hypothetical protein
MYSIVWEASQKSYVPKYSLDRNITIASLFHTQFTPDVLVAEHFGLRNTNFGGSEDLASLCSEFWLQSWVL